MEHLFLCERFHRFLILNVLCRQEKLLREILKNYRMIKIIVNTDYAGTKSTSII
jgi:hypothetical protein